METPKLTREEIAIRIMCAAISGIGAGGSSHGNIPSDEEPFDPLTKTINKAFAAADAFIQERDKA